MGRCKGGNKIFELYFWEYALILLLPGFWYSEKETVYVKDTHVSMDAETTWLPSKARPVTGPVWPLITWQQRYDIRRYTLTVVSWEPDTLKKIVYPSINNKSKLIVFSPPPPPTPPQSLKFDLFNFAVILKTHKTSQKPHQVFIMPQYHIVFASMVFVWFDSLHPINNLSVI